MTSREEEQNIKYNKRRGVIIILKCPSGGIGRHKGLKIPR